MNIVPRQYLFAELRGYQLNCATTLRAKVQALFQGTAAFAAL
jgi:hypothetical protein